MSFSQPWCIGSESVLGSFWCLSFLLLAMCQVKAVLIYFVLSLVFCFSRALRTWAACSPTSLGNFSWKDMWEYWECRTGYGFLEKWRNWQSEELVISRPRLQHPGWYFPSLINCYSLLYPFHVLDSPPGTWDMPFHRNPNRVSGLQGRYIIRLAKIHDMRQLRKIARKIWC